MNSAYLVEDYPYGFKLRTQIRYWLEKHPKRGFRFVSQTLNPKNNRWNAPKKSTYMPFGACMYLDEKNHVVWDGLSEYTDGSKVLDFVKDFPGADYSLLKPFAMAKIAYLRASAEGKVVWKINNVPQPVTEEDMGRAKKEMGDWEDVLKLI